MLLGLSLVLQLLCVVHKEVLQFLDLFHLLVVVLERCVVAHPLLNLLEPVAQVVVEAEEMQTLQMVEQEILHP